MGSYDYPQPTPERLEEIRQHRVGTGYRFIEVVEAALTHDEKALEHLGYWLEAIVGFTFPYYRSIEDGGKH